MPAVLNTRDGTRRLKTGDRVRLDGDRGIVERLDVDDRLASVIEAIDAENATDPNQIEFAGQVGAKELIHARRATDWIEILDSDPSEALRLAARAHHLRRWRYPRSEFPEGRAGYHAWRRALQNRHAGEAGEILRRFNYSESEIARVGDLIRKKNLGSDPEVQTLEDALCLVFVEMQLASFSSEHAEEKVIDIIARSLAKMSDEGRQASQTISLGEREAALVAAATRRFSDSVR